jgi:hypothetical protein
METVLEEKVRKTWQLDANQLKLGIGIGRIP